MIDRGALSHTVNAGTAVDPAAPALPARAERVIDAAGGDVGLARTLMMGAGPVTDDAWRVAVALVGWRAGAVQLRRAALAGALEAVAAEPALEVPFARLLRVDAVQLEAAITGAAADPFAWPAQPDDAPIADVGGFVALDGPFLAPPTDVYATDRPDRFAVATDAGWFALAADVCGHRFAPLDGSVNQVPQDRVEVVGSYLLRIRSGR